MPLLMGKLERHDIILESKEGIPREPMGVEPYAVATRNRTELPQDRCPAAALGVTLDVMLEITRGQPRAQITVFRIKGGRSLIPPGIGAHIEYLIKHPARSGSEVSRVARVVDEDTI